MTLEEFFAAFEESRRIFDALRAASEIDDEVRCWLQEAWEAAR